MVEGEVQVVEVVVVRGVEQGGLVKGVRTGSLVQVKEEVGEAEEDLQVALVKEVEVEEEEVGEVEEEV